MDLLSYTDICLAFKWLKNIAYYVSVELDINETKAFELVSDALQYEVIKNSFIEQCTFLKEQRKDEL